MSRAEVLGELERRFPADGRYARPAAFDSDTGMAWTLDPGDGDYNSEILRIDLVADVVSEKQYLPD